jgi:hypothetical protein
VIGPDALAPTVHRRSSRAWIYLLSSPAAWLVQLEINYVLVPPTRRHEHIGMIRGVSLIALFIVAASALGAWVELGRAERASQSGDRRGQGSRWLATAGVILGIFFCLVIAATALPTWILSPED